MEIFNVSFILDINGPRFSPNLEIDSDLNLFGLINSLLEDIVEMGLYMERIADGYPSYDVKLYIINYKMKRQAI